MSDVKPDNNSLQHQILCPKFCCITFDNPVRKLVQNPVKILRPYIKAGMTILEVGPGLGYFTVTLAQLAGKTGKVIAADLQENMLAGVSRRVKKAGVGERVVLHQCQPDEIGVKEAVDFCFCFWMAHEVPDRRRFFREIAADLKPGGLLLFVEPKVHVSKKSFNTTLEIVREAGLSLVEQPKIFFSYAALMKK